MDTCYYYIAFKANEPESVCIVLSPVLLSAENFARYKPMLNFSATNWLGRDDRERTLSLKRLEPTGEQIKLSFEQGYHGYDDDMGHKYEFLFKFDTLELCQNLVEGKSNFESEDLSVLINEILKRF